MAVVSRWRLVDMQNAEAYYKAIHYSDEHIAKVKALVAEIKTNPDAYIEELTIDKAAGKVKRTVFIKGEKKRDSGLVDVNKEFDHEIPDGRKVKSKITLEGDQKLICHEKGPDFEATITLTYCGDELTATLTSGGVTSTEKYHRA